MDRLRLRFWYSLAYFPLKLWGIVSVLWLQTVNKSWHVIPFLRADRESSLHLSSSLSTFALICNVYVPLRLYICIHSILWTALHIASSSCASAGHDECRSIRNRHIVYGYGFGRQVWLLCRCQKRSWSVAWNL